MTFNENLSTSDNLAANGYGHRPHDGNGYRMVFSQTSEEVIGPMRWDDANEWMRTSKLPPHLA